MLDLRGAFLSSPLFREMQAAVERDRPVPDSQAKRHHLISRFLLKRFLPAAGKRLVQLDVRTGRPQPVTVEAAASRRRFYTVPDDDGETHNRVEAYLGLVESHAAPALERLLDAPPRLERADRATLAFFLALLEGRTLGGTQRTGQSSDQAMRLLLSANFADAESFAGTYRKAIGEGTTEEIEDLRLRCLDGLKDGSIAFPDLRAVALQMAFSTAADTAQLIYQLDWVLLQAAEGEFVTSDRGLAMVDPTPRWPWSGAAWLSSPNVQTTIPLDKSACLLLTPGRGPTERTKAVDVGRDDVDAVNLRTYGWATGYIYGSSQVTVTELRRRAKRRSADVPRPTTPKQVLLIEAEPGDDRLADEHRRRGWPPQMLVRGEPHDYVVLDPDNNPVETSVDVTKLAKERAVRRLGSEQLSGSTNPIDPADLAA